MMAPKCIGGCAALFVLGAAFDITGFALLLVGIFANLRWDGRFYGDFLIYTGSLIVFLSLFWWILWYTGNIQASSERRSLDNFAHWARKLSERLSKSLEPRDKSLANGNKSRITWEGSGPAGCVNEAYDRGSEHKTVELEVLNGKTERFL